MFIDPWSSQQFIDYKRLRREFGIEEFNFKLPDPQKLFRRNIIFGHRGFDTVYDAIVNHEKFAVLTGLMPSGKMHFGHKMTIDQVIYYQSLGADIYIAVADLEAYATRGKSFKETLKIAEEEYFLNYIALGLKPEHSQIYFQSLRKDVTDLAFIFSKRTNISEMKGIYGFKDETSLAHVESPLVQSGDILHVQLDKYSGPIPTVVPVGIDQDPHIRLAREFTRRVSFFSVQQTDNGLGIFIKPDNNVAELLNTVSDNLKKIGIKEIELNIPYKALYIKNFDFAKQSVIEKKLLEIEKQEGGYGFYLPAATYHRLMSSLDGTRKMSSSVPESYISLSEEPADVKKKIMNAKTGGGSTVEEHRKFGGKPEECSVYEYYVYHLVDDDNYLKEVHDTCKAGTRLCGNCKKEAIEKINLFLKDLKEKREVAKEELDKYVRFN